MLLPLLAKILAAGFQALGFETLAGHTRGVDDIPIGLALAWWRWCCWLR